MSQYFEKPTTKSEKKQIKETILSNELIFNTDNQVFSKNQIDYRSKILTENVIIQPNWEILDMGCGYGPIGIALLKKYKDITVDFLDINERAIELTKENLKLNKIDSKKTNIIQNDGLQGIEKKYDTIIFNPPIKTGKKECTRLLEETYDNLKPNGILQIVVFDKIERNYFERILNKKYGNIIEYLKKKGVSILISRKFLNEKC